MHPHQNHPSVPISIHQFIKKYLDHSIYSNYAHENETNQSKHPSAKQPIYWQIMPRTQTQQNSSTLKAKLDTKAQPNWLRERDYRMTQS